MLRNGEYHCSYLVVLEYLVVDNLVSPSEWQLILALHLHFHHFCMLVVPLYLVVTYVHLKWAPPIQQIYLLRLHGHPKLLLKSSESLHKRVVFTSRLPFSSFLAPGTGIVSSLKVVCCLYIVVAGYHSPPWSQLLEDSHQLLHLSVTQLLFL